MLVAMLIAGIGLLLAGLLTVGFGIQLDLSFGNTLILTGAIAACTGIVTLGLWTVVRELRHIGRRLGAGIPSDWPAATSLQSAGLSDALGDQAAEDGSFLFSRDQPTPESAGRSEPAAPSPPPWHEESGSRDRGRSDAPAAPETSPALKPRRNLLFSSSSRKERERAQARTADPAAAEPDSAPAAAPPAPGSSKPPPATFDDAWPKPERARADPPPPRRSGRAPSTFTDAEAGAATERHQPAPRNEELPPVTVLKSGVVDGMAYSLYSDGSIEAQMPEGMMRFASIDELRAHLDQRP